MALVPACTKQTSRSRLGSYCRSRIVRRTLLSKPAVPSTSARRLDSVAWVDPVFTPLNPEDILVGSPFEGDPNTPLFTAAQLAEFQSFDIDISGIPSPTATAAPEPSTGAVLASALVLLTGIAYRRTSRLLVALIDAYETKHYPVDPPYPVEAIEFRMEQQVSRERTSNPSLERARASRKC